MESPIDDRVAVIVAGPHSKPDTHSLRTRVRPSGHHLLRWDTFRVTLAIVTVGVATAWILAPPVYQTNDDVSIRLALEGRTAPAQPATGFTLMTHAALGWPLVYLYRALPDIPWWDLVVAGMLIWGLSCVLAVAWDLRAGDWLARATFVSALLVVAAPLVGAFQFTIGATLGGGVAVLLAGVEMTRPEGPRRGVRLIAMVLLLCALLVRTLGAAVGVGAAGLLCLPLVLARVAPFRPLAIGVASAAVLCVAIQYVDGVLYRMYDEWGNYHRYHWMIVRLFEWMGDLPRDQADVVRASVEWTRNDWNMVQGYFSVDPQIHGYERVARAYETSTRTFGWTDWFRWAGARASGIDLFTLRTMLERSAAALSVLVAVMLGFASRRGAGVVLAVAALYYAICIGIESAFKELPDRLLGPLQVLTVAVSVVAVSALRRNPSPVRAIAALAFVLSVLGQQVMDTAAAARSGSRDAQALEQEVSDVLRLSPSLIILHADTFPREHWWQPFQHPPLELPAIALGWNNQNPLLRAFLVESGRDDLLRAVCVDPSILVIADEGRLDVVTTFFREHHHARIGWTKIYEGSFPVWRCSLVAPAVS